ncbi:hypothetical protein [Pelosinus propionicus]|uniref:Uncharacterized protein n=1 Tax=Pelosinus propionicus DSM 13327 TaxID=1123291 RepID=A0A1I4PFJ1_9FIRM|nr:hypothetical protein [Pelosinus propionicus]SFM26508.1 hypothetical protein SAMN04490355_10631 [Pelosinus propionicus DSM 13327]
MSHGHCNDDADRLERLEREVEEILRIVREILRIVRELAEEDC